MGDAGNATGSRELRNSPSPELSEAGILGAISWRVQGPSGGDRQSTPRGDSLRLPLG